MYRSSFVTLSALNVHAYRLNYVVVPCLSAQCISLPGISQIQVYSGKVRGSERRLQCAEEHERLSSKYSM